MTPDALRSFVCPICREPVTLAAYRVADGQVEEGALACTIASHWYPILEGVPRFLIGEFRDDYSEFADRHGLPPDTLARTGLTQNPDAAQTRGSFSSKWDWFPGFGIGDPVREGFWDTWTASKLGLEGPEQLYAFVAGKARMLDVGCGVGQKLRMMATHSTGQVFGFDLSTAAVHAYRNTKDLPNVTVAQADVFHPPFRPDQFDFVISDGVLHHTPDTRKAFHSIVPLAAPGGTVAIHVYKRMGPLREFADEHLRAQMTRMMPQECWEACKPITRLGQALTRLNVEVTIPEDIPALAWRAGTYDLQRFLYYEVLKCFWNDAFTFEENNQGVFDHYHPAFAHKHTKDEVVGWFEEAGLVEIAVYGRTPNGISVTARAPGTGGHGLRGGPAHV